ncbi:hypothetical protein [Sodalis-like endosymbiont of Proechinophthirus fluctus]|uniref:hypothetical protein n=1 Tax=Sodalis-like endosymbiont of Proechinophthirus fluctus TaxID=1462730 RepID=UPI00195D4B9A|nr:hypothetical protein [Sodalis-like endosymbiont of Proechinophthirus fluctus]
MQLDYFANRKLVQLLGAHVVLPVRLDYLNSNHSEGLYLPALEHVFRTVACSKGTAKSSENIDGALSLMEFIWAAGREFSAHSRLEDFSSDFLSAELGTAGINIHAAVGSRNSPVEIQLITTVSRWE